MTQLTELHEDTCYGLSNLRTLYLYQNELTVLNKDIFDGISCMRSLIISQHDVNALDKDLFDCLHNLHELNVRHNAVGTLHDDAFDGLDSLTALYLDENKLSSLPDGLFSGLDSLEVATFTKNHSDRFPLSVEPQLKDCGMVVRIDQSAAVPLTGRLSAQDGTLSTDTVTIPGGSIENGGANVTPSGTDDVTVSVESALFSSAAWTGPWRLLACGLPEGEWSSPSGT